MKVILEEKLTENAAKLGSILERELRDLPTSIVSETRGKGLLHALVIKRLSNGKKLKYMYTAIAGS